MAPEEPSESNKPDFCTLGPDTLRRYNWTEACRKHDRRYTTGEGTRRRADRILWREMIREVRELEAGRAEKWLGRITAMLYWLSVRLFGWIWWG